MLLESQEQMDDIHRALATSIFPLKKKCQLKMRDTVLDL